MNQDSKIVASYQKLQEAGRTNPQAMDHAIARLAHQEEWSALKTGILEPKIAALYILAEDMTAVMEGREDKETFAERSIAARICAGHIQDIISIVEGTQVVVDEEKRRREAQEKEGARGENAI